MNFTKQDRTALVVAIVAVAVFGAAIACQSLAAGKPTDAAERKTLVVRKDSQRLSTADDAKVTIVEFLDFECEACGAAYPFVEQLRERYAGRVTFVARYFPIPSHRNALNAAYAVESAARQGRFEAMYQRMFETRHEWGERQESMASLFRSYAADLGLDMITYDADVGSDTVADRVQQDVDDGTQLGVDGTPTFFINGERFVPSTGEDFSRTIDEALAQ
jgi:protein-disulfide isomerase